VRCGTLGFPIDPGYFNKKHTEFNRLLTISAGTGFTAVFCVSGSQPGRFARYALIILSLFCILSNRNMKKNQSAILIPF